MGAYPWQAIREPVQTVLLTVAALELQLEQGTPLPFIADDIFINWDDDRTGAGLAALAQLAGKTQVIVLTNHSHLIEL